MRLRPHPAPRMRHLHRRRRHRPHAGGIQEDRRIVGHPGVLAGAERRDVVRCGHERLLEKARVRVRRANGLWQATGGARIERITQRITEQIETEHRDTNRQPRRQAGPRRMAQL